MYSYALNNPLIYTDPDGLYLKPSDWEREQSKERTYCSEIGWKMAGMMGSQFGSYMSRHASGGWEFSSPTGQYVNRFTGDRMSAAQFDSQYLNPAYIPASVDYGWGIVATMETEGYDLPINVFGRINTKIAANRGDSYGPNWVYSSTRGEIGLGVSTFTGITGFSAKESLKLINNADASFDILKGVRTGSKVLGSFTAGVNLGISFYAYSIDRTWGNAARVGVSGLALGLSLGGPYTAWAGFGISALDTFGAFDGFYDNLNFNQELYNSSGYIVTPSLTPAMPGYHFLRLRR